MEGIFKFSSASSLKRSSMVRTLIQFLMATLGEVPEEVHLSDDNTGNEGVGDEDASDDSEEASDDDDEASGDEVNGGSSESGTLLHTVSRSGESDLSDGQQVISDPIIPVYLKDLSGQMNKAGDVTLRKGYEYRKLARDIQRTAPPTLSRLENDTRVPHICWPWGLDYAVEYKSRNNTINPLDMDWYSFSSVLESVVMTKVEEGGDSISLRVNNNDDYILTIPKRVVLNGYPELHKVIYFYKSGYKSEDTWFINKPPDYPWLGATVEYFLEGEGQGVPTTPPGYEQFLHDLYPWNYVGNDEEEAGGDENDGGIPNISDGESEEVINNEDDGEGEEDDGEDPQVVEADGEDVNVEEDDEEGVEIQEADGEPEDAWVDFVRRLSRIEVQEDNHV